MNYAAFALYLKLHIIPKCAGGSNEPDNLISVCRRCHAILTPKRSLTKYGLEKVKRHNRIVKEWERFYKMVYVREAQCAVEVIDIFDEWFLSFLHEFAP